MSWFQKLVNKARGVYTPPANAPQAGGCDHGAIKLRQGTAEFEWFIARAELETTKNLFHGAGHLANLLSYDPGNPEWVELLERYLAEVGPDPESLIPRGEKLYYGTEAMRAYIWNKQGKRNDAINLLVNVVHAKQDARYLEAWAQNWLEPAGAAEAMPEQLGMFLFSVVLNRFAEARMSPSPKLREARRWAALAARFFRKNPGSTPQLRSMGTMLQAGLFRKAGLFAEAEAIVRAMLARSPDWHTATALGLVLRQKGDLVGAEKAFEQALQLDPKDISARLEAADTFFERQQYQPALKWYENALGKEPQQPWALPSSHFCRWKLTGDESHLRKLVDLAKAKNDRAGHLCNVAFYGELSEPSDATANILRNFREKLLETPNDPSSKPGEIKIALSCLEAPSNFLAFQLEMEALKRNVGLTCDVEQVPKPDPRKPMADVKYVLWKYEGTNASPGLPAPPEDVVKRIAALAALPYELPLLWAAASRVAEQVGPARVGEVLATMVHPPPVPAGKTALAWIPRVQLAAAQVAAHVDAGWEGSARREALLSVLHGPSDWATEAAIRALSRLGVENEAFAPDIGDAFQVLANHRPNTGYCCWIRTLYQHWLDLPYLFPNEREEMQKELKKLDERAQAQ